MAAPEACVNASLSVGEGAAGEPRRWPPGALGASFVGTVRAACSANIRVHESLFEAMPPNPVDCHGIPIHDAKASKEINQWIRPPFDWSGSSPSSSCCSLRPPSFRSPALDNLGPPAVTVSSHMASPSVIFLLLRLHPARDTNLFHVILNFVGHALKPYMPRLQLFSVNVRKNVVTAL